MKKILVASFQRSGTHFLINALASNFEGIQDGWIDVVHSKKSKWVNDISKGNIVEKIREQLVDSYYPDYVNKCVKTHYQMYFFERYIDVILQLYDVLYIVRDPRDVMVACFNYYNKTGYECFIKDPHISSFIRRPLWDVRTEMQPFSFSYIKPKNIVDKWHKHVLSWLHYKDKGVYFVKYSGLRNNYEETLRAIETNTSQRLRGSIVPVTLDDPRYRPDFHDPSLPRGEVGVWKNVLSSEDLAFISESLFRDVREITFD
jgi:hypothetical protein